MSNFIPAKHEGFAELDGDRRPSLLEAVVMVLTDAGGRFTARIRH